MSNTDVIERSAAITKLINSLNDLETQGYTTLTITYLKTWARAQINDVRPASPVIKKKFFVTKRWL